MSTAIESKAFWEEQLEKLKASGLSRSQYCRVNDINYDRFGYWIRTLSATPKKFIPVKVQAAEEISSHHATLCTLELHGHILKIHDFSALSFLLDKLS